jgi:hypothetical protein
MLNGQTAVDWSAADLTSPWRQWREEACVQWCEAAVRAQDRERRAHHRHASTAACVCIGASICDLCGPGHASSESAVLALLPVSC